MTEFQIEPFVESIKAAAKKDQASELIREIMQDAFKKPQSIKAAFKEHANEDEILFEDDSLSIWFCAFDPNVHVPPHDHQTTATIGVFEGVENNHFYQRKDGKLVRKSTKTLQAGDVVAIGPDGIHSVETGDDNYSLALHVYQAKLTTIERSLFEWDSGEPVDFNDANYDKLERRLAS